jgi:membrane glycosyltransferase
VGRQVGWTSQQRSDQGTSWLEAIRFHWSGMVLGLVWGGSSFLYQSVFFWWNTPIIVPLLFSIPLSVFSSSAGMGYNIFQKLGVFSSRGNKSSPGAPFSCKQ